MSVCAQINVRHSYIKGYKSGEDIAIDIIIEKDISTTLWFLEKLFIFFVRF